MVAGVDGLLMLMIRHGIGHKCLIIIFVMLVAGVDGLLMTMSHLGIGHGHLILDFVVLVLRQSWAL